MTALAETAAGPQAVAEAGDAVSEGSEAVGVDARAAHSFSEATDDQPYAVELSAEVAETAAVAPAGVEDDVIELSAPVELDDETADPALPAEGQLHAHDEPAPVEVQHASEQAAAPEAQESAAEPVHVEDEAAAVAHAQDTAEEAGPSAAVTSASDVPVLASAAAALHQVSTFASGHPMDAARHQGHSAGGPPPESSAPVMPSDPPSSGGAGEPGARVPEAPVTRTVRIEVPDRASSSRATGIDRLLRAADALGASELFLVSQSRPYVRAGGNVRPLQDEPLLLASDIETLIAEVTPEPWRDAVRRGDPADWLIELPDIGRVRCATFRDHRGPGANFHFSFLRAATADDLQLSAEARRLATEPDGLVLVAGAAGSEVASIVAAFVDLLNQQRADYIITLEPQVRTLHLNREALVSQREVGSDPARAATATLAALREQPDVLVIESLGSSEVAQLAIDAAAQNRLVIVSIDAPSAAVGVQRLLELVPADQRSHARGQLSRCFRGAVAQQMLRKASGGKIAARELLTGTRAVTGAINDGDLSRLAEQLESAAGGSLAPLADTVVDYVRSGLVDVREALRKAPDAARLTDRLKAAGADLSAVDSWN
jgi:twitching motility protein PilT